MQHRMSLHYMAVSPLAYRKRLLNSKTENLADKFLSRFILWIGHSELALIMYGVEFNVFAFWTLVDDCVSVFGDFSFRFHCYITLGAFVHIFTVPIVLWFNAS